MASFGLNGVDAYANLRSDRSINPADAIQLACAAAAEVDLFITNDGRLSRKSLAGVKFFIAGLNAAPV